MTNLPPDSDRPGSRNRDGRGGSVGSPVTLPKVLRLIKQSMFDTSERLLNHMFSSSDDVLYDLSQRAQSNREENMLFEAMREIRVKRKGLSNQFLFELTNHFNQLVVPHSNDIEDTRRSRKLTIDDLSLVEGDKLESDIAINNMIASSRLRFKEQLYPLTLRLDHLSLNRYISQDTSPLDPKAQAESFGEAAKILKIDFKAKLILLKLFEKHVLRQMGEFYKEANQILADHGVLPIIPKGDKEPPSAEPSQPFREPGQTSGAAPGIGAPPLQASGFTTPPSPLSGHPGQPQTALAQSISSLSSAASEVQLQLTLHSIANLMAAIRPVHVQSTPGLHLASGNIPYYNFTAYPGPQLGTPTLSQGLARCQSAVQSLLNNNLQSVIPDMVDRILHAGQGETKSLNQSQEDIINLVSLFFENVLGDHDLSDPVQAIICRMQIPVLRIALEDQDFFENKNHYARRFINTITDVATGFESNDDLESYPLFQQIRAAVSRINEDQETTAATLKQEYKSIAESRFREKSKSSLVEERTTQKEAGLAKNRQAQQHAKALLLQRMKNVELPSAISSFLTDRWLPVLIMTYMKLGRDNAVWVDHEQLVTDLIWLAHPHTDKQSRARRPKLKARVLQVAYQGIASIEHNPERCKTYIDELSAALAQISDEQDADLTYEALTSEQQSRLQVVKDERRHLHATDRMLRRSLSGDFFALARDMDVDTWFEYLNPKTGEEMQCKLSAKVDPETYIFVDRQGRKRMVKSRREFAYDLQYNKARVVDTNPAFDRVMKKVVDNLVAVA